MADSVPLENLRVREDDLPSRIDFLHSRGIPRVVMPFHYHRIFEIYYCQTHVRYLVGNRFYDLEQGDLLILNNFDIHHSLAEPGRPYERSLILFPPEIVSSRSREKTDLLECFRHHDRNFNHRRRLSHDERDAFEEIHRKGRDAMQVTRYGSDVERRLILEEALLFVNRIYRREITADRGGESSGKAGGEDLNQVSEIMSYIDAHIGEDLSLSRLSRQFGSTPNGLNRLFKGTGAFTVHQYILGRRMQFARLYLSEGRSVTDVAYDVGYKDLAHFIRIFKEKTGLTPGRYGRQDFAALADSPTQAAPGGIR